MGASFLQGRPRRNRKSEGVRSLVSESRVALDDLIYPLFLVDGQKRKEPIPSMPGQFRFSLDELLSELNEIKNLGLKAICLFPACEESQKDPMATWSHNPDHFYLKGIREMKSRFPELVVMSDVAMDPYSSDGHDGLVDPQTGEIKNDETLEILGKMALSQAKAGVDIIGPSDMMDGRVGYLREVLDSESFTNVSILSYTAKYASSFYGPFREALDSAPKAGDKKTYQMDPANAREALLEASLDELEGADMLMVKPGLAYLDIIAKMRESTQLPVAAYNVSGEYAMVKAAHEKGWIHGPSVRDEMLLAFKRAGADMILTYFAKEFALRN